MADAQIASITVPLDQNVWQVWIEKNRMKDERFEAKIRKLVAVAGAGLVAVVLFLLARRP